MPRSSGRTASVRATITTCALAALAVVGAGTALATARAQGQQTAPRALPTVVEAVAAARRGAPLPPALTPPLATIKMFPRRFRIPSSCYSHDASTRTTSRVCRVGHTPSRKLLVLVGDSHAFMWLPAVLVMAKRDGWTVVPLIRFGCTPGKWFVTGGGDYCATWFRWAVARIRQLHPSVTLLGGSIGERPSAETESATAGVVTAARLLKPLGRLVVIGDPEGLAVEPVPCLTAPHASLSSCMTTWPASSLVAYDRVARATETLGVGFLPTRGFVCYRRQCPAVVGRTIVWMDNSHLTGIYSAQVAGAFRSAFLRVVR